MSDFHLFNDLLNHSEVKKWPRQESNLHLKFRKLLFYPLNYGAIYANGLQK